jgi:hypothetical protein
MRVNIKIQRNQSDDTTGKLADAELHFIGDELDGLKLVGFAIWRHRDGNGCDVTFPARELTADGRPSRVPLLCSWLDPGARKRLRDLVLREYEKARPTVHARRWSSPRSSAPDAGQWHGRVTEGDER